MYAINCYAKNKLFLIDKIVSKKIKYATQPYYSFYYLFRKLFSENRLYSIWFSLNVKTKTRFKNREEMKKVLIFFMMGAIFSLMTGCDMDDDGYSLDNAWVGFGLVQKDSEAGVSKIVMDDNEVLFPATNDYYWHEVKNNDRVLVNFTILGNKQNDNHDEHYYVRINSLRKILYKGILDITPAKEDSIGNDAIKVKDKWIKGNMLNFELKYYGGSKIHYINLVKQPGVINPDNGPVVLELRHNNNDDGEHIPLSAMVTFDLSALKVQGKTSTPFKVIAKGFEGDDDFEFTAEYKY